MGAASFLFDSPGGGILFSSLLAAFGSRFVRTLCPTSYGAASQGVLTQGVCAGKAPSVPIDLSVCRQHFYLRFLFSFLQALLGCGVGRHVHVR